MKIYEIALKCVVNEDLKEEWEKYQQETERHVQVLQDLCLQMQLDPQEQTPGRQIVHDMGMPLVAAMEKALSNGDQEAAQCVACECVVLAETTDHSNWELIGEVAKKMTGAEGKALKQAHKEVEDQEDASIFITPRAGCASCRSSRSASRRCCRRPRNGSTSRPQSAPHARNRNAARCAELQSMQGRPCPRLQSARPALRSSGSAWVLMYEVARSARAILSNRVSARRREIPAAQTIDMPMRSASNSCDWMSGSNSRARYHSCSSVRSTSATRRKRGRGAANADTRFNICSAMTCAISCASSSPISASFRRRLATHFGEMKICPSGSAKGAAASLATSTSSQSQSSAPGRKRFACSSTLPNMRSMRNAVASDRCGSETRSFM